MRICFISRRFWPAVSGMSVYASNLLRELVRGGHEVTMISQYRDDPAGKGVYGGGPPPEVPGVRVIGLESVGEQRGGDFELDIERMVETVEAEHEAEPFDIIHAQYGYPTGLAALEAGRQARGAERGLHTGRGRPLGRQVLRHPQAGHARRSGPCWSRANRIRLLRR